MKAKYLVQVYTNNKSMSVVPSGFYTMHGTQTKASAVEWLKELEALSDKPMRVISAKDFSEEIKQANRLAFNLSK